MQTLMVAKHQQISLQNVRSNKENIPGNRTFIFILSVQLSPYKCHGFKKKQKSI